MNAPRGMPPLPSSSRVTKDPLLQQNNLRFLQPRACIAVATTWPLCVRVLARGWPTGSLAPATMQQPPGVVNAFVNARLPAPAANATLFQTAAIAEKRKFVALQAHPSLGAPAITVPELGEQVVYAQAAARDAQPLPGWALNMQQVIQNMQQAIQNLQQAMNQQNAASDQRNAANDARLLNKCVPNATSALTPVPHLVAGGHFAAPPNFPATIAVVQSMTLADAVALLQFYALPHAGVSLQDARVALHQYIGCADRLCAY